MSTCSRQKNLRKLCFHLCQIGHVLRREDSHVLRRALDYEVEGQRKKERPNGTLKKQVEEESVNVGVRREDALCRSQWSVGVNQIAAGLFWPSSLVGDRLDFKHWWLYPHGR